MREDWFQGLNPESKESNRKDFAEVPVRNDMGLNEEGVDGQQGVPSLHCTFCTRQGYQNAAHTGARENEESGVTFKASGIVGNQMCIRASELFKAPREENSTWRRGERGKTIKVQSASF